MMFEFSEYARTYTYVPCIHGYRPGSERLARHTRGGRTAMNDEHECAATVIHGPLRGAS